MKNYFLCLKPKFDTWLEQWFVDILKQNMQIVRTSRYSRRYTKSKFDKNMTAIVAAEGAEFYLFFCSGRINQGLTLPEVTSNLKKSELNHIHIKLLWLKFQELDHHDCVVERPIFRMRKLIMDHFSFTKEDAEKFIVLTYLLYDDVRQYHGSKNKTFLHNLPTYNDLKEMNIPTSRKFDPLKHQRYCSMQKKPIWNQEKVEDFFLDVIQPYIENEYIIPSYKDVIDKIVIKNNIILKDNDRFLYKLIIQFVTSYSYSKNLKFFYLYTPPPCLQKKRISDVVKLEVLFKCSDLHKNKPKFSQTQIMKDVSNEIGCEFSTIDKFIKANFRYLPDEIKTPMDLFCLSNEEIKNFYTNYLIGHGQNPKNFDLHV